jgi:hypothetical protein
MHTKLYIAHQTQKIPSQLDNEVASTTHFSYRLPHYVTNMRPPVVDHRERPDSARA